MAEFFGRSSCGTHTKKSMSKKDYIWTFNDAELSSGLSGAFSLEYNVSGSKLKVAPDALVGSRIWLIVRSGDDSFLYAFLSPSIIELYQEGKYKDDYLLRCESFSSVRFLPRQESRDPWLMPVEDGEGIRECTDVERSILLEIGNKNQRIGFVPPSRAILESIPRTAFSDLVQAVPDQLMLTLRSVSFGDVSRSRSLPNSISALGCIALTILKSTHPHLKEEDVINLIATLDPLAKADEDAPLKTTEAMLDALSLLPPIVDTFLEEIDPEKISPRIFVARTPNASMEWLNKTNEAEQAHEQILKDVVQYLKNQGFKIFKTRSFDLFVEKAGTRFLWEIKSANCFNTVSQGEKGIMQLLRYSIALADAKSKDIRFFLLMQDSGQREVHQYLSKIASRTGVELWLYDEKRTWPQRVSNLNSESPNEGSEKGH